MPIMRNSLIWLFAAVLLSACSGRGGLQRSNPAACGMDEERFALVDSVVAAAIDEGVTPGAVVAVVRGDKIAFLKAYGQRQTVPSELPMTENTVFDLASLSKCVGTTIAVMQLIEQGRLRLTDRVDRYIPGFVNWQDADGEDPITIQDLLTHSSGLPPYIHPQSYLSEHPSADADSLMAYIATGLPRSCKPGTKQIYSCLGFITLQHVVEQITGERLCDYVQRNVFDALGMSSTCYFPIDDCRPVPPECAATEVLEDGHVLLGEVHDPTARLINKGNSGNAGVFSSAPDICVMAAALMNGGEILGRRILGRETVRLMFEIPRDNDPAVGRALGWDTYGDHAVTSGDIFDKDSTFGHTGYTGTSIIMNMRTRTAVIILANRVHPTDSGSMAATRAAIANIVVGAIVQ